MLGTIDWMNRLKLYCHLDQGWLNVSLTPPVRQRLTFLWHRCFPEVLVYLHRHWRGLVNSDWWSHELPAHVSTYSGTGGKHPCMWTCWPDTAVTARHGRHVLRGRHLEVGDDGGWVGVEAERSARVSDGLHHLHVDRFALARQNEVVYSVGCRASPYASSRGPLLRRTCPVTPRRAAAPAGRLPRPPSPSASPGGDFDGVDVRVVVVLHEGPRVGVLQHKNSYKALHYEKLLVMYAQSNIIAYRVYINHDRHQWQ